MTTLVANQLRGCDYLYLEANHEISMVYSSARPMIYKQRVLGRNGHLSNQAAGELLCQIADHQLKHVHLAHLSSECNTPETALRVIRSILESRGINLDMCIAPQDKVSKAIVF